MKKKRFFGLSIVCLSFIVLVSTSLKAEEMFPICGGGPGGVDLKPEKRCTFINKSGEIQIDKAFRDVKKFSEGRAAVKVDDEWGFINKQGEMVIQPKWGKVENFSEGLARVGYKVSYRTSRYGFIDKTGKQIIEIEYENIGEKFSDGRVPYEQGGKVGFLDKNGDSVIKPQFGEVSVFSDGAALVKPGSDFTENINYAVEKGLIENVESKFRKEKIKQKLSEQEKETLNKSSESKILSFYKNYNLYFFINPNGEFLTDGEFLRKARFKKIHHGLVPASKEIKSREKWGYLSKSGEWEVEPKLPEGRYDKFHNGLAKVTRSQGIGYINKKGEYVIDAVFSDGGIYSEGLIAVRDGFTQAEGKIRKGYINKKGEMEIEGEFAGPFKNGLAKEKTGRHSYTYINRNGEEIKPKWPDKWKEGS